MPAVAGADCYYSIADNLVQGNGYTCERSEPYTLNSMRPPLQPYFVAGLHLLTGSFWGPTLVQILLGSIVPLLGMALARYVAGSGKVVLGTGVLLALEPYSILFSTFFYSETLFTVLLLSSILALFRYIERPSALALGLSGLFLGLATLTKPTAEYVGVIYLAVLGWHYRRALWAHLPRMALFVCIFVLTLLPWVYRNHTLFGVAGVSPQLGEQLNAVLVPSVLSFERGTTFDEEFSAMLERGGADPNKATIADSGKYLAQAVPILLDHPRGLVLVSANTALNFFIHDGMIEVLRHIDMFPKERLGQPALFLLLSDPAGFVTTVTTFVKTPAVLVLIGRLIWIVITASMLYGLWRLLRQGPSPYALALGGIISYFMLTTLVIGLAVAARYRLPVNALIIPLALYGAACVMPRLRSFVARYISRA